jgi:hypothetical protein
MEPWSAEDVHNRCIEASIETVVVDSHQSEKSDPGAASKWVPVVVSVSTSKWKDGSWIWSISASRWYGSRSTVKSREKGTSVQWQYHLAPLLKMHPQGCGCGCFRLSILKRKINFPKCQFLHNFWEELIFKISLCRLCSASIYDLSSRIYIEIRDVNKRYRTYK